MMGIKGHSVSYIFYTVLIIFLILSGCDCHSDEILKDKTPEKIKEGRPPPVDLSLTYIPGGMGDRSVVVLKIFNVQAHDASLHRVSDHVQRETSLEESVKPYTLKMKKGDWLDKVHFYVSSSFRDRENINEALMVIEEPKGELVLDETQVYQVIYVLSSHQVPEAGSTLDAELDWDGFKTASNKVKISSQSMTDFDQKRHQSHVFYILKDADSLQEASEALIEIDGSQMAGYWFQGLAYELTQNYAKAYESFQLALSKVQPKPGVHSEPPVKIIQKIREIKKRL